MSVFGAFRSAAALLTAVLATDPFPVLRKKPSPAGQAPPARASHLRRHVRHAAGVTLVVKLAVDVRPQPFIECRIVSGVQRAIDIRQRALNVARDCFLIEGPMTVRVPCP
jgi:hypothetical protein